jgi:hypothetical protein
MNMKNSLNKRLPSLKNSYRKMVINDDWLVREALDKQIEALDAILKLIKDNNLLSDSSFNGYIDNLYKLIYKYSNND